MFTPSTIDTAILNKLRSYYPAFNSMPDSELWRQFVNLWNKLMASLCWDDNESNSLLESTRTIYIDLNPVTNCNMAEIFLKHNPIKSITSIDLIVYSKLGKEIINIPYPEKYWIEGTNEIVIYIDNITSINICKCDRLQIKAVYVAGYSEIPEAFYTVLGLILANAICSVNDCIDQECSSKDRLAANAVLSRRTIENDTWEWDIPNNILQDYYDKAEKNNMLSMLGNYSNCINKLSFATGSYY